MKRGDPGWVVPPAEKSAAMRRVRTVGTAPEIALRRRLHGAGLRFRVAYPVPGRPRRTIDIAFTRRRLAVFVDGCFWHGCPLHGATPATNTAFWRAKVEANRARDRDTDDYLARIGWTVLRVWEHVAPGDAMEAVGIALAVGATGGDR
jgi:DNA mismatch endonuclease (patch repair protein)